MSLASFTSRAYVLHARPWRETSLLIDWFTESHGRVTAKLQGARQAGRRAKGRPMPFQRVDVQLSGRGEILTVASIDLLEPPRSLPGQALAAGFYCNELLIRAVHRGEALPELFDAYAHTLTALADTARQRTDALALTIRSFERELLDALGVSFDWSSVTESGILLEPDGQYRVSPEWGIAAEGDEVTSGSHAMRVTGRVLLAIGADEPLIDPEDRRLARDLMRWLLVDHVGPRPFQSRQLWRALDPSPVASADDEKNLQ